MCIPVDHAYEAQAHVRIENEATGGLILFYNPSCYCGVEITGSGVNTLNAVYGIAGKNTFDGNEAFLRLVNDRNQVLLFYSKNGQDWHKTETSFDTSGYHHNSFGGFTSLRLGFFAAGSGKVSFADFKYRAL